MFIGCREGDFFTPNCDDEMSEVLFNFGGDYVSVEETPLVKAVLPNAKTIYALQIYETDTVREMEGRLPEVINRPYAYGLFDNVANIRISLAKEKKYIVNALIIEEREDTIFLYEGYYGSPFYSMGFKEGLTITNQFIVSSFAIETDGLYIAAGFNRDMTMARVDRYCGSRRFDLSGNSDVGINMDRYAFSFTYNVTPPIDGAIRVKLADRVVYEVRAGDNQVEKQVIHSAPFDYMSLIDDWYTPNVTSPYNVNVTIEWERGCEELRNYMEKKVVKIKRKTNYNLYVNMNGRDNENALDFNRDTEPFADETLYVN